MNEGVFTGRYAPAFEASGLSYSEIESALTALSRGEETGENTAAETVARILAENAPSPQASDPVEALAQAMAAEQVSRTLDSLDAQAAEVLAAEEAQAEAEGGETLPHPIGQERPVNTLSQDVEREAQAETMEQLAREMAREQAAQMTAGEGIQTPELEAETSSGPSQMQDTPLQPDSVKGTIRKKGLRFQPAVRKDWPSHDVEWTVPGYRRPVAYSTVATSNSIGVMADDHPADTIAQLRDRFLYDAEARRVLDAYINNGYGDQTASEWFSYSSRERGSGSVQVRTEGAKAARRPVRSGAQAGVQQPSADVTALEEENALLRYKSGGSYQINAALRDGTPLTQEQQRTVDALDRALEKLPTYSGTVYRRLSFDLEGREALDAFLAEHQPGGIIGYPAYTSASTDQDGYPVEGDLTVTMVIEGRNGRNMAGIGNNFEKEVVYPRESVFSIDRIETDSQGNPVLYMKEVIEYGAGQLYSEERGQTVQQMQEEGQLHGDMLEVSGSNPQEYPIQQQLPGLRAERGDEAELNSQEQLAGDVRRALESGEKLTAQKLFRMADRAYGGTMAEGTYTVKDAYDGMELAVNQYLLSSELVRKGNASAETAKRTLSELEKLLSTLPTQTKRTTEMEQFQQFSTPPNIAYLAAWTANVDPGDVVLEPSAGIGGLALWPKAWGATVYVNELSERRLSFLKKLDVDETFNFNAEQIDNLLPERVKPTLVLMNPPFSATAGRTATNKTANAKRHVEQALERLEPGGRLVAILGRGMSEDAASFKSWWREMKKTYNVRANIQIDGENYKKYGTSFDVQLVVIDKNGPTTGETLTGVYQDLSQVPEVMEDIRNDRPRIEGGADHAGQLLPERVLGPESSRGDDGGDSDGSSVRSGRDSARDDAGGGRKSRSGKRGRTQRGGDRAPVAQHGHDERPGTGRDGSRAAGHDAGQLELERRDRPESQSALSRLTQEAAENPDSVYAEYAPKKVHIKGAKRHPAKLVESAAMAAVDPPDPIYTPQLPEDLVKNGVLSDAQLENVVYAGQAHEQMLPNGVRKGYFIGDGTGVGKGRQIAGIILDNFNQGRTKAVWVTNSKNLYEDAVRDWTDLGGNKKDVLLLNKVKAGKDIPLKSGILFTSYDTLKSGSGEKSRLDAVKRWLGEDFDGVIALDEAHNMANAISQKGARGKTKPAARALAGIQLQETFPKARVVYASATGATDVSNYAYLERLGLWGPGTAFHNVNDFISKISSGGLAAMELVARDMKSMGVYMARSISYDDVTYDTLQHDLTPMQTQIYDTLSDAWQKVFQNMEQALKTTSADKNGRARGNAVGAFYSAQQRFYNQVLTSMSMPSVIEDIKKELAKGHSCVLQIVNTNAAAADRAISKAEDTGADLEDMDMTPSEVLVNYLENSFPVQAYEEYTDDKGNTQSRPVQDKNGKPVLDRKAVRQRDALIEQVRQMKVPDGPLEMLFDAFGTDQVAEVTGRTRRVVEKPDENGHMHRVVESRSSNSGIADAQMFQDGKKRILVFSDAGGTGKSYHADLRAKNQQQRVHYLLQPGWSASKATQGFGRTHRSNEASAPIFRLVTTNVMGQKRFTSTIARRLDQLGALTKGQRQAGSGIFGEKDNLENPISQDALQAYYKTVPADTLRKLGLYDKLYDQYGVYRPDQTVVRDVGKFLNRILSLEVEEQNQVFNGFYETFDRMMSNAIANGTVDMGLENYVADHVEVQEEKVIRTDPSGADTKYVQMTAYRKPELVPYGDIEDLHPNFQKLVRLEDGSVRAVYEISTRTNARGEVERRFRLESPVRGRSSTYVENTLNARTTDVPKREWKKAWEAESAKAPEFVENKLHMLTGTLLPIWDRLPASNTRVMRVLTTDGQYLGRLIRGDQIDSVLKSLGTNRTQASYTPQQVFSAVMEEGKEAVLRDNRVRINRRRVSGENRMEITGNNVWYLAQTVPGLISERINYAYRYFIPTGEKGIPVLQRILELNPAVDLTDRAGDEVDEMARRSASDEEVWNAERVGEERTSSMPLSDIIEKIRHDFGLNITVGHIQGRREVLGRYDRNSEGIRVRIANDLPTVSHELGHHLDNVYNLTQGLPSQLRGELVDNLGADMKAAYPKKKWTSEGLAEFVRRFLQNRETAAIDYPEFTKYFLSTLKNTDGPLLEQLADEVNAYYSAGAKNAADTIHFSEERGTDFRAASEKIRDAGDEFYQAWVDSNHGIWRFDREAGSNTYILASNAAYSDSMAGQILVGDLTDPDGQYVGPGLKTALSGVNLRNKQEYRAFGEYLTVKHGPERLKEGLRVFADERKNSTTWMQVRQAQLEAQYPQFKDASERLYQFQTDFLRTWGVGTGLVAQESAEEWGKRWSYYVPFNRYFARQRGAQGARRGFANQSSGIHRARGSGEEFRHPVDNVIYNVVRMVNAGTRNHVMDEITRAAERSGGMATFLEKVPPRLRATRVDMTETKNTLLEWLEDSDLDNRGKEIASGLVDNLDDVLMQYSRDWGKTARGNVITVMKHGRPEAWKINDPLLLSSISNLTPQKLPAVLEAYGAVSRFMTGNLTGNNLLWSIFSNAPRDVMTLWTYSKDKNLPRLLGGIMSGYANRMKGQNADPLFKEYLAMGGGHTSAYTADRKLPKRTRQRLTRRAADYLNPMEVLSAVSDCVEMGPRYAYYKILRQRGVKPQEAFYQAMDVTVNFRRAGANSRALNNFVPFFNASVQGLDRFARELRATDIKDPAQRRKAVRARTIAFVTANAALAALIYALNNRDEEAEKNYEQLSTYTKNSYWCLPLGNGEFFTIPKPRELAVLSSFFESLMEYHIGGNRHALDGFYDYAAENLAPSGISDLAKGDWQTAVGSLGILGVGAYMMANRDFMGRPIVSSGLQSLEPKDQYTGRTSAIAKAIGGALSQSPQMIDYFFQQTLGGWWKAQKALFPVDGRERDLTLGIQGTYVRDNQYSTDLVDWMYNKADASDRAKNSDRANIDKAITAKWDANMTSFYSRYYKLAKDKPETTASRATRQTVLNMILEYQKASDAGTKTRGQIAVEEVCRAGGNTEYLPSVMQSTVKSESGKTYTLTDSQYVEYQTEYLRLYWESVEDALPRAGSLEEQTAVLKKAKNQAADTAKARVLKRLGADYDEEELEAPGGVSLGEWALFEAAYDMSEGEKDRDGDTIPGSVQEDVIEALEGMDWLTDTERRDLFASKYESMKNNPWRWAK